MATEAQTCATGTCATGTCAIGTCAIGIITILIALYATQYEIRTFMQNKANLLNAQIIVTSVLTKDYENVRLGRGFKNKAKQTQSNPIFNPKNAPFFPILDNSSLQFLSASGGIAISIESG